MSLIALVVVRCGAFVPMLKTMVRPTTEMLTAPVIEGHDREDTIDDVEPVIKVDALLARGELAAQGFKSGFVAVVGSPNVGKSTLVNSLVGQRLCIATSKAQTTRHGILGVAHGPGYQIALTDTPGVLSDPAYALQTGMMQAAGRACRDAEALLVVTDIFQSVDDIRAVAEWANKTANRAPVPVVVVVNKVDLFQHNALGPDALAVAGSVDAALRRAREAVPYATAVLPVSALKDDGAPLARLLADHLPQSDPVYHEDDMLTDRPARFFAAEIVREHILQLYSKEIPYSCEVRIDRFNEDSDDVYEIDATILVARDSQKGILIGAQGSAIKQLGINARIAMEDFFQVPKVRLALNVKTSKNWRADTAQLKAFGYLT